MGNIALAYIKAILLYWLTLKDGSEVWLVEPAWVATRANNRNTLIEQSPRCIQRLAFVKEYLWWLSTGLHK